MNCDIQLINGSINLGTFTKYTGDAPAKWYDGLVSSNHVTLIASAGNSKAWQEPGWPQVISPASGYNSIAAGAYSTNGNSENDVMFDYRYNPTESSDLVCYKPDMVIAANSTSEASPSLSGIVSMLIQLKPSLAANPELIKAILMASCHRKVKPAAGTGEQENIGEGLTQRQGAGAIDAYRAVSIVLQERYGLNEITSGSLDSTPVQVADGHNVNVSLAWLRKNTNASDSPNSGTVLGTQQELDLGVYADSELVASSVKRNAGKQMVYFPSSALNDQYTIRVTKAGENLEPVRYAYAWSTEDNYVTLHAEEPYGEITQQQVETQLKDAGIDISNNEIPFSVGFDETVKYIGDHAFDGYGNLAKVTIRRGITKIGKYAFNNCSLLESIEIPSGLLTIDESAFQRCYRLKSAVIGNSVRSIESNAFYQCSSLSNVIFQKIIEPTIRTGAFAGLPKGAKGHIPVGAVGYAESYDDLTILHERDMRTIYFTNNGNWENIRAYMRSKNVSYYNTDVYMNFAYHNYLGQDIFSVTFDYNEYQMIYFHDEGSNQTVYIDIGANGTGYYLTTYDTENSMWNVSSFVPDVRTIYFTNTNNWTDVRAYMWKAGTTQNNIWHGVPMKYVETNVYGQAVYSITMDFKEYDCVVFNDFNSSEQTVDISIGANGTGYYLNGDKSGNHWLVNTYFYS